MRTFDSIDAWHAVATAGVGIALVVLLRWVGRRSPGLTVLIGIGVLLRLTAILAFFWASYLAVPQLESMHSDDGFWSVAPDARSYFLWAADAWERDAPDVDDRVASPSYVRLLAGWMHLSGPHAPGAALLNTLEYVVLCVCIIAVLDPRHGPAQARAAALAVTGFTLSPAFIVFGAQTLKDATFALLTVTFCIGTLVLFGDALGPRPHRRAALGTILALGGGAYMLAGMRPYFPLLLLVTPAVAFGTRVVSAGWRQARAGEAALLVLVLLAAFVAGAGTFSSDYARWLFGGTGVTSPERVVENGIRELDRARDGFERSGGDTNIALVGQSPSRTRELAIGMLALVVPISLLRSAGLVAFEGGRGLLAITDLDSVFLIASFAAVGVVLVRDRRLAGRNIAFLAAVGILSVLLAVMMGYVVTNFGTLFRLRLMVATLVWTLPLALCARAVAEGQRTPASPSASAQIEPLAAGGAP